MDKRIKPRVSRGSQQEPEGPSHVCLLKKKHMASRKRGLDTCGCLKRQLKKGQMED